MKKACTLAEVLIVLMVIGVICTMTIPTIIKYKYLIKPSTQTKTCEWVCN